MRRSTDLPGRRRRITGRTVLITIGALFLFVVIFGRAAARFYVDYLWYASLGRGDVFWGQITAKLTLFGVFFVVFAVVAGLNLYISDRLAPRSFPANVHPFVERFHEMFGRRLRVLRYGIAAFFGVLLALSSTSQWQNWLLFRHSRSFGVSDPQFGVDVGFYMFELPFLAFVVDWLFIAVLVTLLLTAATHVLNGGVVFASPMPSVRNASKAHIAVLLAVLAALKAADYWVSRYDLTNTQRGFVQGATYAVVNAQMPAMLLLMLVAVLTSALFLSSIKTGSWRLPLLASGLWVVVALVGGLIYPALVQRLVVKPNQQAREAPFIERNVVATKAAFGIDDVEVQGVSFAAISSAVEVEADLAPLQDVRLLNPAEMRARFQADEGQAGGLAINDLDVDRYVLDDRPQQVLVAARELDLAGIGNRSWQGQHLINTRGCGLVMAPASTVRSNDDPDFREVLLDRPELYFSPSLDGYAVVGTDEVEQSCGEGENEPYSGDKGVRMSSFPRRAAFALAFLDYNVLGSGSINRDSQMLWVRDVRDRVDRLAPFLSFDADPYPVDIDGRAVWVIDGYTTSSQYPYAQRIGDVQLTENTGLSRSANYVRNSVKATVDAYDGSVTFYVTDTEDPVLRAWRGAFPDLFTDEVPAELREHFRYPEDLFRVQTDMYSKYQLDPANFFNRAGAWSVAQAPTNTPSEIGEVTSNGTATQPTTDTRNQDFASESGSGRFVPYYTFLHPGQGVSSEFVILRPFVEFSPDDARTQLRAYMTASSEPETYGQLVAYELEGELPAGPLGVAREIETEAEIASQITLLLQRGSGTEVRFGDLQLVPVSDGLLWVRPMYVAAPSQQTDIGKVSEYRFVIVYHNGQSAMGSSLREALAQVFDGFDRDVGDRVGPPVEEDPEASGEPPGSDDDATVEQLLSQADDLFTEAETALVDGDLGTYQEKVDEARELLTRALELLESDTS
jgi:uncharacterized membrane protein (UPF0182 family)